MAHRHKIHKLRLLGITEPVPELWTEPVKPASFWSAYSQPPAPPQLQVQATISTSHGHTASEAQSASDTQSAAAPKHPGGGSLLHTVPKAVKHGAKAVVGKLLGWKGEQGQKILAGLRTRWHKGSDSTSPEQDAGPSSEQLRRQTATPRVNTSPETSDLSQASKQHDQQPQQQQQQPTLSLYGKHAVAKSKDAVTSAANSVQSWLRLAPISNPAAGLLQKVWRRTDPQGTKHDDKHADASQALLQAESKEKPLHAAQTGQSVTAAAAPSNAHAAQAGANSHIDQAVTSTSASKEAQSPEPVGPSVSIDMPSTNQATQASNTGELGEPQHKVLKQESQSQHGQRAGQAAQLQQQHQQQTLQQQYQKQQHSARDMQKRQQHQQQHTGLTAVTALPVVPQASGVGVMTSGQLVAVGEPYAPSNAVDEVSSLRNTLLRYNSGHEVSQTVLQQWHVEIRANKARRPTTQQRIRGSNCDVGQAFALFVKSA